MFEIGRGQRDYKHRSIVISLFVADFKYETLKTMYYWPHMRAEVQAMGEDREGRNDFRPSLSREPHNAAMR